MLCFFFSSRRRHTSLQGDWSSDVCSSDLFARETRAYSPHLTLARLEPNDALENLVRAADALKSYDFGAAREPEFHLFQSVLKPSGAQYSKLAAFPFVKGA